MHAAPIALKTCAFAAVIGLRWFAGATGWVNAFLLPPHKVFNTLV